MQKWRERVQILSSAPKPRFKSLTHIHARTRTHTRVRAHAHTHKQTHTHTYARTHTHTLTYALIIIQAFFFFFKVDAMAAQIVTFSRGTDFGTQEVKEEGVYKPHATLRVASSFERFNPELFMVLSEKKKKKNVGQFSKVARRN